MPLIANTLPLNLSTVKTAYGSGGNELRDYIPGGGINGHVLTPTGVMGTGTIKLSDFKGSTRVNFGENVAGVITPNSTITIETYGDSTFPATAAAESRITLYSNTSTYSNTAGQLLVKSWASGLDLTEANCPLTGNTIEFGKFIANTWLLGASSANSQFDPDLFNGKLDILWNPTSNTGGSAPNSDRGATGILTGNANVWVNWVGTVPGSGPSVYAYTEREVSTGTSSATYQGYLAIRMNASPQTVLCNVRINLFSQSTKSA